MAERGYGWEKLISEMFCQEYWAERGMKTFIARFHNVYGPNGTWDGGREKAPAAICRKVIEAKDTGKHEIEIWGDGTQTRSFMYIDDCTQGIDRIMHCDDLIATPINLGSSELISINDLVSMAEEIGGVKLQRQYDLDAPKGVAGRNSDNTMIKRILGWEPTTPFRDGPGQDLRLDRAAVPRSQGRQADGPRHDLKQAYRCPHEPAHHRRHRRHSLSHGLCRRLDRPAFRFAAESRAAGLDGRGGAGADLPLHGPRRHGHRHAQGGPAALERPAARAATRPSWCASSTPRRTAARRSLPARRT